LPLLELKQQELKILDMYQNQHRNARAYSCQVKMKLYLKLQLSNNERNGNTRLATAEICTQKRKEIDTKFQNSRDV